MGIETLKADIKAGTPSKFYIFTGSEWMIQKIYIQKLAGAVGKEYKYIDSVSQIFSKLNVGSRSFISKSYVYVVRDDIEFISNENMQTGIERLLGDNILILQLSTADKRTKFYKKYESEICVFDPLVPSILKKYLVKEILLNDDNFTTLMQICENDYGRCLLEIDKIKRAADGTYDDAFYKLVQNGTIYIPPKDAIFEFIDAILDCDNKRAFDLYEDCKAINEAVMIMISVLYNNAKAVLQVQAYEGSDITEGTGLTKFQIMGARKHIRKRSNRDLIDIMHLCQRCQEGIVTGKMEEEFVMDYILGEIL